MADKRFIPLATSHRERLGGARRIGPSDPGQQVTVSVVLRRRAALRAGGPAMGACLSREDLAARHGASEHDLDQVAAFAREQRLAVVSTNPRTRIVKLSGSVADLSAAFRVQLLDYEHPRGNFRGRVGPILIPEHLDGIVAGVLGLDNRPQAEPRIVFPHDQQGLRGFTPIQIKNMYNFPPLNGEGQTIALIELGGGFKQMDLDVYFAGLGLATPSVAAISVDGAQNSPTGNERGPDGEVMMDIEIAGAIAPAANIAVYFAPNTDQGFLDAILAAIYDEALRPAIISISWGGPENAWTSQAMQAFDGAFADAGALGVSVFCASGDSGSSGGGGNGAHADFPASSPNVTGCGGTRLNSPDGSTVDSEVVWNDDEGATGGGVSEIFDLPAYQDDAGVPVSVNPSQFVGRGVPDVAGVADPETGYYIRVDGKNGIAGGTSAVAPLWAGLTALINQYLGMNVGFMNPLLYADSTLRASFRDIELGNNGAFSAGTDWDACTGWGSPDGIVLMNALAMWWFVRMQQNLQ